MLKKLLWCSLATVAILANRSVLNAAEPAKKATVQNVTPDAAQKLITEKKVIVLDVRTEEEFKEGHIKGATNLNFFAADFEKKLSGLDKSKAYLVHCAAGGRSAKAIKKMEKLDFTMIYHLDCGMNGWEDAHKPTVKE